MKNLDSPTTSKNMSIEPSIVLLSGSCPGPALSVHNSLGGPCSAPRCYRSRAPRELFVQRTEERGLGPESRTRTTVEKHLQILPATSRLFGSIYLTISYVLSRRLNMLVLTLCVARF